jgi:hypothetical protein
MNNGRSLWKYAPPPGPVIGLLLIGLVLLSSLLYYRSIKIQRFLEPALALSQPRNEFTKNIKQIIQKEFGADKVKGLTVRTSSIVMETSLLFSHYGTLKESAQTDLQKLARVFLALMKDDHLRSEISLVLIIGHFPSSQAREATVAERMQVVRMVGFIQDALFKLEPELGRGYPTYFAATVRPMDPREGSRNVVEFRIIPSEYLHIEVLEKLEKYSR